MRNIIRILVMVAVVGSVIVLLFVGCRTVKHEKQVKTESSVDASKTEQNSTVSCDSSSAIAKSELERNSETITDKTIIEWSKPDSMGKQYTVRTVSEKSHNKTKTGLNTSELKTNKTVSKKQENSKTHLTENRKENLKEAEQKKNKPLSVVMYLWLLSGIALIILSIVFRNKIKRMVCLLVKGKVC